MKGLANILIACFSTACLLVLYSCRNKAVIKKEESSSIILKMDSLSKAAVEDITNRRFDKGVATARQVIAWAIPNGNDSILAKLYGALELYYTYKDEPSTDSADYYFRLFVKHAEVSGNNRLLLLVLSKIGYKFEMANQFDSAIVYYQKRYALASQQHDTIAMLNTQLYLGSAYEKRDKEDTAFGHYTKALDLYTAIKYKYGQDSLSKEGRRLRLSYLDLLYQIAGYFLHHHNYSKSLEYYRELNAAIPEHRKSHNPELFVGMGECFEASGQSDSAMKYYEIALRTADKVWYYEFSHVKAGRKYGTLLIKQGNNKEGAQYLFQSLQAAWRLNKQDEILQCRLALALYFIQQKQWQQATDTMQAAAVQAQKTDNNQALANIYDILYQINERTGNYKQALQYVNLSHSYSDSLITEQSMKTVAEMDAKYQAYKKNQQITLLQKDNRIQQLQLSAAKRLRLFYISGSLILLALLGIIYYYRQLRQRHRARRIKTELEAKALRAQMNPHFIFNCLNAIQELIITEDYTESYQYLSKFSRLLRMVLHASEKNMIPLRDEIEMCRLYVELESLRLKYTFTYCITTSPAIDTDNILLPTLLMQPFIENAIWHGLSPKQGEKTLNIKFEEREGKIICTITDNGVGREKAAEIKASKIGAKQFESKGILLTQQRMEAFQADSGKQASISIVDCKNEDGQACGTKVEIQIPVVEKI